VSLNTITVDAPPARVWDVLGDASCYPRWVVGAKDFRGADRGFPAVGSRFHHSVGFGPITLDDHTEVLDVNPPWRIELRARARPLGTARVVVLVQPQGDDSSYVTLIEDPGDPMSRLVHNPVLDALLRGRNVEALRRLKALVERQSATRSAPA
jgi:uncharacterized protein YndB with AHSA1/START domain